MQGSGGASSVEDEREDVAEELRRVRDEARAATPAGRPTEAPPPPEARGRAQRDDLTVRGSRPPEAPDATAVNASWTADAAPGHGLVAFLRRALERLLGGRFAAQREWNAHQVRLDNEILRWVEERFAATHRHYDRLLGLHGQRLDDVDGRHALLERELVAHVRDLVRRIDEVLAESTRERAALEFALEDVRARLVRLEGALRRRA
jgi:hypothetical protein